MRATFCFFLFVALCSGCAYHALSEREWALDHADNLERMGFHGSAYQERQEAQGLSDRHLSFPSPLSVLPWGEEVDDNEAARRNHLFTPEGRTPDELPQPKDGNYQLRVSTYNTHRGLSGGKK